MPVSGHNPNNDGGPLPPSGPDLHGGSVPAGGDAAGVPADGASAGGAGPEGVGGGVGGSVDSGVAGAVAGAAGEAPAAGLHPAFRGAQWKKGQSGNPAGRRKGPSLLEQVDAVLAEEVDAEVNGRRVRVRAVEVLARRLVKRMLEGDMRAVEVYLSRREAQLRRVEIIQPVGGEAGMLIRAPRGGLSDLGPADQGEGVES